MSGKHIKDHEKDIYVDLGNRESAIRTLANDLNAAIPQNWKGITLTYTNGNVTTAEYYSDAAKTTLIKTISISYNGDGNITGVTSV